MEAFSRTNPWWFYKDWTDRDRHLSEWSSHKHSWIPSWISRLSLKPFSLNFVYGVRQVGKTTGLKLLIKELIEEKKSDPQSVFYIDLDYVASLVEFRKIIESLLVEKKKRRVETSYIFMDEVTAIEDWWRIVKYHIDSGDFSKDIITVSGSSTIGLIKVPERFPGRVGWGTETAVLPLSFSEYASVMGYRTVDLLYDRQLLEAVFENYRRVGGFPRSINGQPGAEEAFVNGLVSEIYKHGKSSRIAQDILSSVLRRMPGAMSYNSVATDLGISHNTVREYIDFFRDLLIAGVAYHKADKAVTRRDKKIFLRDPFIGRSIAGWVNTDYTEESVLEHVVQEHLFRKFGEVYYFRNRSEIDVISGGYKIELKTGRAHKVYPKDVMVLSERDIPSFLLTL
jgi:predicted AAA+ superfamily ATPase